MSEKPRLQLALRDDLAATWVLIQTEPDLAQQAAKLEELVQEIAVADLPAAIECFNQQNSSALNEALKLQFIRRWTSDDPRTAADWVSRMPAGPERHAAINGVAIVWANQNLSDAVEWARQLPDNDERNSGLMSISYEAARSEPVEALRLALELPANEAREDLISHAAREWAAKTPQAATEWANQLADGPTKERVLANIAAEWGDSDPIAAATLAIKSLPAGKRQDDALVGVVQRWVQTQPEAAAAWVESFPPGTLRDTALDELVKLWSDQNLEQTEKWLNGQAAGSVRDVAVGAYATKLTPQFPALAAHWAADIGDQDLRIGKMEAVGELWMSSDATAARSWITQAALPETSKVRLLALNSEPRLAE